MSLSWPSLLAATVVLLATASAGGLEHDGAWILRALAVGAALLIWPNAAQRVPAWALPVPLFALGVVTLGTLTAPNPGLAMQALISCAVIVGVYFAFLLAPKDCTPLALNIILLAASAQALWAVVSWGSNGFSGRQGGGFINPNELAAWLAPLLVLLWGQGSTRDSLPNHWRWPLLALLLAALLTTGSRAGVLGAALAIAIVSVFQHRRRWLLLAGLSFVSVIAVISLYHRFVGAHDPYAYSRVHIWQRSIALALEHPLGVGLNHFEAAMRVFGVPLPGLVQFPKQATRAHSEPLNAWVELGWPGLLAVLLAVGLMLFLLRSQAKKAGVASMATNAGVLMAFAVPALVHETLHVPIIAMVAALWAAQVSRSVCRAQFATQFTIGVQTRRTASTLLAAALIAAIPGMLCHRLSIEAIRWRDAGNIPLAHAHAQLAERFAPWSEGAALLVASLNYAASKEAITAAEELVGIALRFPHSARALQRALWLLQREFDKPGKHDTEALLAISATLQQELTHRDPKNARAWFELGELRQRQQHAESAMQAILQALNLEPNYARALARLALHYYHQGKLEEARSTAAHAQKAHKKRHSPYSQVTYLLTLDEHSQNLLKSRGLLQR